MFIRFVFGRIQAINIPFNNHFDACSTANQAVLSNTFYLISVIFKSAPQVHQNIVQMTKGVLIFIRFVFGRIQVLKLPFNYHFKACSTAYQAVLSNIFYLISVIFNSAPKVHQYIVQMSKSVMIFFCHFVVSRIQAIKIPFNYHFKACSTAYQAVLSNIFYLISVIFKSAPKVHQNIVQIRKSMMIFLIHFILSRIQALKIPFNYHFKACSTAYQAVLSNIFYLISVIFNSAPKEYKYIVQVSKSVTMFIRFVFGRIQALKMPFNYHFKACSTAYQAVLSNIFYLISVIFNITPKVRQYVVQMCKSVMIFFVRLVFGRTQALKNPFNYHFKASSTAYQAVFSNSFYLMSVISNSAPKYTKISSKI